MPERLLRILRSLSADGRDEPDAIRSIEIRARDMDTVGMRLRRPWPGIERLAGLRRDGAGLLLKHLIAKAPPGVKGVDVLVETTYGNLEQAIRSDTVLTAELRNRNTQALVDRALLWMHEQEVITLNRGLTVFRPAMTLKVARDGRPFTVADFQPLRQHYAEKTAQIHVVAEYARLGMDDIGLALRLAMDYFELDNDAFVGKWFKGKERAIRRETLPDHYAEIVTGLNNRVQESIVADDRERTNALVLAGPGSGKTRVLVHRIAWLIRVRREDPGRILALTYNRHAAVEARRRLDALIGKDARRVNVMTCHALAMRVLGLSFADTAADPGDETFRDILRQATKSALGQRRREPGHAGTDHRPARLDSRGRVPGHRRTRVRTHRSRCRQDARRGSGAAQSLRGRRRRPERVQLQGRFGPVHPAVFRRLPGPGGLPDRKTTGPPATSSKPPTSASASRSNASNATTRSASTKRAGATPRAAGGKRWTASPGARSAFFALPGAGSPRPSPPSTNSGG